MFNFNFNYPIGIDIGVQHIYAAQLKHIRQGFAVRGLMHQELDGGAGSVSDRNDTLLPLLKNIVKSKRFVGKRVVLHIPHQNIVSFPMRFQVGKSETPEEVILRESKEYLPFPMEEAVIDYPSIVSPSSDSGTWHKVTIIAVRRDDIKQYLLILKKAGLIAEAVDFDLSSLIRLHNYLYNPTHNPILLFHIGYTQSLLSIVTKECILAYRYIPWGIEILVKKLLANLGLANNKNKAEILLRKYGLAHKNHQNRNNSANLTEDIETNNIFRAIYQIIMPFIEELIHEFHKIIAYVRSEKQNVVFESIYISGQASLIRHLDRYLENRLNIPTKLIDPVNKMTFSDSAMLLGISECAPFALALGLAMKKVSWL